MKKKYILSAFVFLLILFIYANWDFIYYFCRYPLAFLSQIEIIKTDSTKDITDVKLSNGSLIAKNEDGGPFSTYSANKFHRHGKYYFEAEFIFDEKNNDKFWYSDVGIFQKFNKEYIHHCEFFRPSFFDLVKFNKNLNKESREYLKQMKREIIFRRITTPKYWLRLNPVWMCGIEYCKSYGSASVIPNREALPQVNIIGYAFDLDKGKIYISLNGNWILGNPNTNETYYKFKPNGREYSAMVQVSNGTIVNVNFGSSNFKYPIPKGFKKFQSN